MGDLNLPRMISCFDCDGSGTLYGVCQAGSEAPTIIAVDARQDILSRCSNLQGAAGSQGMIVDELHVSMVIKTITPIDFHVKTVSASRSGHYLLLVGFQDEDYAAVAVVDVYGGRILTSKPSAGTAQGASPSSPAPPSSPLRNNPASSPGSSTSPRCKECSLHHVDPQLYQGRPGLVVYQASWHPHSDSHLAVLTSDSCWRLYSLEDLSLAEQSYDLRACLAPSPSPGQGAAGPRNPRTPGTPLPPGLASPAPVRFGVLSQAQGLLCLSAFTFGPPVSWGYFTVLFMSSRGEVFALCPVCPFGMRVPASVLKQALASSSSDAAPSTPGPGSGSSPQLDVALSNWVKLAFAVSALDEGIHSKQRWIAQRHVHEDAPPSLQGPLNADSASASAASDPSTPAVALHSSYHLGLPTPSSSIPRDAAAAPGLSPQSCTSCVVTGFADGRLYAHVCHGLLGPCWGEGAVQCVLDVRGDVRAVRYQCSSAPLAAPPSPGASSTCGSLLLLDAIDLQLPPPSLGAPGADDEDLDEEPEALLGPGAGLRRLALGSCQERPQLLWACHESGCWSIDMAWLPKLSQALAAAGGQGLDAASSLERMQLVLETVPPPVLQELSQAAGSARGGTWLAGVAVLPDLFQGDSLLLLQRPGVLPPPAAGNAGAACAASVLCFRLGSAGQVPGGGAGQEEAGSAGKEATAEGAAPSPKASSSSSLPAARRELMDANIKAIYGDLIKGWSPLQLPKPTGPVGSQDPEGALHLARCISLMRQHHVEFIHRADQDMRQRIQQLGLEVGTQRAALAENQQLLAASQQRQLGLAQRAQRMAELHRNLQERSELLAQLHWSLPRSLSEEEVQLGAELDVFTARSNAVAARWEVLRRRVEGAMRDGRGKGAAWGGAAAAGAGAGLPAHQASKVHATIMEQFKQISAARHEVQEMEASVQSWKLSSGSC